MLRCRSLLWLRLGSGEYSVSLVSVSNVQGDHAGNAIVRIFATHDAIKTFFMQLQVKVVVNPAYTRPKWQCSQHNGDTVSCWYGDYGISNMFTSFAPSLRELSDGWLTLANKVPSCGTMMTPCVSLLQHIYATEPFVNFVKCFIITSCLKKQKKTCQRWRKIASFVGSIPKFC